MNTMMAAISRTAAWVDNWHWVPLLLASPLLLFPSPERSLAMLVVPGGWLVARIARRDPLPRTPLNLTLLLLGLTVLVSLYATYDIGISLPKIAGMMLAFGVYFAYARLGEQARGWRWCLGVFLIAGAAATGVGLLSTQWLTKIDFLSPIVSRLPRVLIGLPGAEQGLHPNEVAGALLWVTPVVVMVTVWSVVRFGFLRVRFGRFRALAIAAGAIGLTLFTSGTLLLTQSRSGYIGLIAGAVALIFVWLPSRFRRVVGAGLAIIVILAGVLLTRMGPDQLLRGILGLAAVNTPALSLDTFEGRLEVWSRAVYAIQDFPLTGMGMNTFRRVVHVLYPLFLVAPDFDVAHAHNEFLQAALDLGLPGLIAFIALYLGAFGMLYDIWHTSQLDTSLQLIALGLGGGLVSHLVYGLTDTVALGAKPAVLFWMLLGLVAGLYSQARATRRDGERAASSASGRLAP